MTAGRWFLIGLGLVVVGFVLCYAGLQLANAAQTLDTPSMTDLIVKAINEMFAAAPKIVNGPTPAHQLQGLGSIFTYAGIAAMIKGLLTPGSILRRR
jgi:hypothetical protein